MATLTVNARFEGHTEDAVATRRVWRRFLGTHIVSNLCLNIRSRDPRTDVADQLADD